MMNFACDFLMCFLDYDVLQNIHNIWERFNQVRERFNQVIKSLNSKLNLDKTK